LKKIISFPAGNINHYTAMEIYTMKIKILLLSILMLSLSGLSACSPKVGSDAWCKKMDEKAKGDWTANEAGEYAKNCVFK